MNMKKLFSICLTAAVILTAAFSVMAVNPVFAENDPAQEVHYLAFASDRHGNTSAIEQAFAGMPSSEGASVEYVSIIGDMVGSGKEKAPAYDSSAIYDEIVDAGFSGVKTNEDMSILWADHDEYVNDDAKIVFADKGTGSGLMKTGLNNDGTPAYYIYGIAFYDMTDSAKAEAAAEEFMDWVDTLTDNTVPVIVLCHVPLHYARGDNRGAIYWSDALNYAATGEITAKSGETVIRDVVYMHGHNHTVEYSAKDPENVYSGEFYVPRGAAMEIGAEENHFSRIYYTYTTAGYLKDDPKATLITIDSEGMKIEKYYKGEVADGLYDAESRHSGDFATRFLQEGVHQIAQTSEAEDISAARTDDPGAEYVYTGSEIRPEPAIMVGDKQLGKGNYWIRYKNNVNAGTAKMIISGKAANNVRCSGALTIEFTISKAKNPVKVSASMKTVKYSALKKAKMITAPLTVNNAAGTVRYSRVSGSKKLTINKKNGKITIKKGTRKGTYRIKVKITADGDVNHLSASQKVSAAVRVK
ncbi:MAG: hypothetical protein IKF54_02305 [Eubacterium sp.]|nr:hypothetical protein [Eubacterium sp.]